MTAYTLPGRTADNTAVQVGVAACPPSYRFGDVVYVYGYGRAVCHDVYAPASRRFDVWVPSTRVAQALTGRRAILDNPDNYNVEVCN